MGTLINSGIAWIILSVYAALKQSKKSGIAEVNHKSRYNLSKRSLDLSNSSIYHNNNQFLQKPINPHITFSFANIQTKLRVSQPGDVYEQEADKVAEQIMTPDNLNLDLPITGLDYRRIDRKCESLRRRGRESNEN